MAHIIEFAKMEVSMHVAVCDQCDDNASLRDTQEAARKQAEDATEMLRAAAEAEKVVRRIYDSATPDLTQKARAAMQ